MNLAKRAGYKKRQVFILYEFLAFNLIINREQGRNPTIIWVKSEEIIECMEHFQSFWNHTIKIIYIG